MAKNSKKLDSTLDEAVRALRSQPEQTLPPEFAGAIIEKALNRDLVLPSQSSLFLPTRRWMLAGLLPVMAVAALLAVVPALRHDRTVATAAPGRLTVSKVDGEVVFTLANGTRQHTVCKSTVPNHFDPASAVRMKGGSFTDRTEDGEGLVFYRID